MSIAFIIQQPVAWHLGEDRYIDEPEKSILEVVGEEKELSSLLDAVQKAGLAEAVAGLEGATLIAPTNSAFAPFAELNGDTLRDVLSYHVTPVPISEDNLEEEEGRHVHETLLKGATWEHDRMFVYDASGQKVWINRLITAKNGTIAIVGMLLLPRELEKTDFGALNAVMRAHEFRKGHNI